MKELTKIIGIIGIIVIIVIGFQRIQLPEPVKGSAFPGARADKASSSRLIFTTDNSQRLFASTTGCVSRIVTTSTSSIVIQFNGIVPTQSLGHLQTSSTTVAYDSGIYGCGGWFIIANPVATDIIATEFIGSQ